MFRGHGPHEHHGVSCSCQSPQSSPSSEGSQPAQLLHTRIYGFIDGIDRTSDAGVAVMYSDEALFALICLATSLSTEDACVKFLRSMELGLAVITHFDLKELVDATEDVSLDQTDQLSSAGFLHKTLILNLRRLHTDMFSSEPLASAYYNFRYSNDLGVFEEEGYAGIRENKYLSEPYREKLRTSILRRLFVQAWDD
jgi:hypothetical protein